MHNFFKYINSYIKQNYTVIQLKKDFLFGMQVINLIIIK